MNLGINVPLDWISRLFTRRKGTGSVSLRKGAKYELNGAWFEITEIYPKTIVMEPVNKDSEIVRV